jgi:formate dehydrogenase subunit delta
MNIERLVQMANDIGHYFASEPDRSAGVEGVATHIARFWEPRMRRQIVQHVAEGGAGLSEIALAAVRRLAPSEPAS